MIRLLLIALLALALAACGGDAPTDDGTTALPPDDSTPDTSVTASADATLMVEGGGSFEDMTPLSSEISIEGAITPAADARIVTSYSVLPLSSAGDQPRRRLIITVPLQPDLSSLATFTLYIPEGGGAGSLVRADIMTPEQFGVSAYLFPDADNLFTVTDPATLSVQGDLRVLDAGARLTAAFDFTITNGLTNESVRVVGRVNQIPST